MKYTEFGKKKSKSNKFYIVIAFCLLIIGGASWFALSQFSVEKNTPESNSSEYNQNNSSYNSSDENNEVTESTAQKVESEPYSKPEETKSEPEQTPASNTFMMPVNGEIIKNYDESCLQFSKTFSDMRIHLGVDIACKKGDTVSACSDGKILSIEKNTSLGTVITIDHGNSLTVKYASLENIKVKIGDSVKTGDALGTAATVTSECADDFHLHIEAFKDSKPVSPLEIMGLK